MIGVQIWGQAVALRGLGFSVSKVQSGRFAVRSKQRHVRLLVIWNLERGPPITAHIPNPKPPTLNPNAQNPLPKAPLV